MPSTRQRLSVFDRLEPPELWEEAVRRSHRVGPELRTPHRKLVAAFVAAVVFVPTALFAFQVLSPDQSAPGASNASSNEVNGIFFPVEREKPVASMAASLTSRLQVHNGCLFAGPHQTALLLWPYGAQLASPASGQPIRVLDASGHVIAQAGLPMDLGGGYVSENPMNTSEPERLIGARIPERCRPTYGYWLVGDTNF